MRAMSRARWAACALAAAVAVSIVPVAIADRGKSLASCTAFDQADKGEDKVEFTISNTCTVPIDCSISWRVVCAPESKKRRAVHPGAAKLALIGASKQSAEASAEVCGDAGWTIDQIHWRCEPNKD